MCMAIDAAIYMANKIVDLKNSEDSGYNIDIFKVHKMLYYAQGLMLVKYNDVMFNEAIRAHRCGPYVDGLRLLYMTVGEKEITKKISLFDDIFENNSQLDITDNRKEVLNFVVTKFGKQSRNDVIFETKTHSIYINTWEKYVSDKNINDAENFTEDDFYDIYGLNNNSYLIIPICEIKTFFENQEITKEFIGKKHYDKI